MFGTEFNVSSPVLELSNYLNMLSKENKHHFYLWLYHWHDTQYASLLAKNHVGTLTSTHKII